MDAEACAYFRDNYLSRGISFEGLKRFQSEFRPDIISQVTGRELYQIILEHTRPPETRPFINIPYYDSGEPFFAAEELGEGNVYVSYQWDAPFSQVFDAASSLPNRDTSFFMIHIFCCPSEESLTLKYALSARLEYMSQILTKSPIVWLGVVRWSSDMLDTEWLLSRRWILTEILLCLSSGAAAEFYCCLDGVHQPRKRKEPAASGGTSPFANVSSLVQLLK